MSVTTSPLLQGSLKARLRRAERVQRLRAIGLVAPLFIFILITFVVPIIILMTRSVDNPEVAENLPLTMAALSDWDATTLPDEAVFAALVEDLKTAQASRNTGLVGKRLNYEISGARSKLLQAGRAAEKMTAGPYKEQFLELDDLWGKVETWQVIQRAGEKITSFYLLKSLDLQRGVDGAIVQVSPDQRLFVDVFIRTLGISTMVTVATLLLGFPLAYILATLPVRHSNLLMIFVLLPFWTSLLVRTTAWVVVLQTEGPINDLLLWTGLTDERLQLIFSRFGTIVAMTHIQLPFTLLPIYSVMKTISPNYVRAARSLGSGPFHAFWTIYFPQTMPGIAAGCLLTFILCLGYYITPALVGGPTDQMISYFVALYTNRELNWGQASALGGILLLATLVLYAVYNRLVGIDKMKLG
ncbi:MAG: ABC transporter permease [Rhodospirillaceae bacterium]|nr:ABC transporter permease [Rhodospirillaceae bacterium]